MSITVRPPTRPDVGASVGELFAHPLGDTFGDGELISLGSARVPVNRLGFVRVLHRPPAVGTAVIRVVRRGA
ncbi:hypothetical protein [Streptomyces sp. SM10]|uniref:hypothetical protein n=1 Tax=Streptomyces sp. SM10 TaxID=565556 RepID=UPI0015E16A83|nr:hypothetical protein [Streptomyces sp. SM10]